MQIKARLTKDEHKEYDKIDARLREAIEAKTDAAEAYEQAENAAIQAFQEAIEKARSDYASAICDARAALAEACETIEAVLDEARSFALARAEERQEAFDGKSESWQEGDAGAALAEWIADANRVAEMGNYEPNLPDEEAPDVDGPQPWDGADDPELDDWETLGSEE